MATIETNNKQEKLNKFYDDYKLSLLKKVIVNATYEVAECYHSLYIPAIKKIDNIEVCLYIRLNAQGFIEMEVETNSRRIYHKFLYQDVAFMEDNDDKYELNDLFAELQMIDWKQHIFCVKKFKFNKTLDRLIDLEVDNEILTELGYELDECCVCYDTISYKLTCGHYLCYDCNNKIVKHKQNELCPLCKQEIVFEFNSHYYQF